MKIKILLFFLLLCPSLTYSIEKLTETDKELWMRSIKRVKMKPPCCGACKIITISDAKMLWEYLSSESPEKKNGKYLEVWLEHKKKLLEEFKTLSPERYATLYGKINNGGVTK